MKKTINKKSKTTMTGLPKDDVNVRPTVAEAAGRKAVITFGRMNPVTTGHQLLANKLVKVARAQGATPLIFLSHSQDAKKNPLSYDDKLRLAQAALGKSLVVKSNARTIIEVLKQLQTTYDSVIVVVGSDRVPEFERIVKTYNGKDFKYKDISVLSAGTRDPDSDDVSGMSASKMREAAKTGNMTAFKKGLPAQLHSMADMVMAMVRTGMNIKEEMLQELESEGLLNEVLTLQQRRKKALIMRRYKNKIKIARQRQQKRMADTDRLRKRAARAAIRLIRRRVAGKKGVKYAELTPAEKAQIDKRVQQRKSIIGRLAKRLLPKVRSAEMQRLKQYRQSQSTKNESINFAFEKMLNEQNARVNLHTIHEVAYVVDKFLASIEKNYIVSEKAYVHLYKKSNETGAPLDDLVEAYTQGYRNPREGQTKEQSAFLSLNHFVAEGKKKGLWDNIHAKRARIKAGSGERMRKPGSEGAPTAADFKRAANEAFENFMETKAAPKGYHFTKSGELKKGDADVDGPGGSKLRADPLDKVRRKIPPLPEAVDYTKSTDQRQEREKKNLEIRHARQDAAAKVRELRAKTNEEFEKLHELYFKVEVESLPTMYVDASSAGKVKVDLRRILKRPDETIKNIERIKPSDVRKVFRDKARGDLSDTSDLDEGENHSWKSTGHYTKDGKEWKGPQHAHNGQVMTGKEHGADSENLYHFKDLSPAVQKKLLAVMKIKEALEQGTDKLVSVYKQKTPGQGAGVKGTNQHKLKMKPVVDGEPKKDGIEKPKL